MTDRERYKRAFSALEPSRAFSMEVETMKNNGKRKWRKALVSVCVAAALVIAGATAAYAADFGGFRETVTQWFNGNPEVLIWEEREDGSYALMGAYGQPRGKFIPSAVPEMTLEEFVNQPFAYKRAGRSYVSWYDQVVDITDQFNEDGICQITMEHEGEVRYVTVYPAENGSDAYNIQIAREYQEPHEIDYDGPENEDAEYFGNARPEDDGEPIYYVAKQVEVQ